MTVLQLTEGLRLIEANIRLQEGIDWKEQRAATTEQEVMSLA
jgi:hypothetical protein